MVGQSIPGSCFLHEVLDHPSGEGVLPLGDFQRHGLVSRGEPDPVDVGVAPAADVLDHLVVGEFCFEIVLDGRSRRRGRSLPPRVAGPLTTAGGGLARCFGRGTLLNVYFVDRREVC